MSVTGTEVIAEVEAKPADTVAPSLEPTTARPSDDFRRLVAHEFARRHLILSAGTLEGIEQLLVADQTKPAPVFNVGVLLLRPVSVTKALAESIAAAIDRVYLAPQSSSSTPGDSGLPPASADVPIVVVEGSSDLESDLQAAGEGRRERPAQHPGQGPRRAPGGPDSLRRPAALRQRRARPARPRPHDGALPAGRCAAHSA